MRRHNGSAGNMELGDQERRVIISHWSSAGENQLFICSNCSQDFFLRVWVMYSSNLCCTEHKLSDIDREFMVWKWLLGKTIETTGTHIWSAECTPIFLPGKCRTNPGLYCWHTCMKAVVVVRYREICLYWEIYLYWEISTAMEQR